MLKFKLVYTALRSHNFQSPGGKSVLYECSAQVELSQEPRWMDQKLVKVVHLCPAGAEIEQNSSLILQTLAMFTTSYIPCHSLWANRYKLSYALYFEELEYSHRPFDNPVKWLSLLINIARHSPQTHDYVIKPG